MRGLLVAVLALRSTGFAQEIGTAQVVSGLISPTDIQHAGDGSGRLFFAQQNGVIRVFRNGALLPAPFLDIRSKTTGTGERGLLGLAFPPGFAEKRRFYVHYTDLNGDTTLAQYRLSADLNVADGASETILLKVAQPFPNHNGGQIRFGPDGYLYFGLGDGGSGGDPQGNGQNRNALLRKILRIDVEGQPGTLRVPPANPFANTAGARGEVWAYGLRNPWRFSFDRDTNDLWIADVGQESYEEVNFQPAASRGGENYGWNRMEGLHCYVANCNQQGLTLPVAEYLHAQGCSVTGGFVYRGTISPGLRGIYLYGDLCSGRIWGIERQGSGWANRLLLSTRFAITTFGEDEAGEVYVADANTGSIHRITGSAAPRVSASGVANAASFAAGLTPGSLATIFASGVLDAPGITGATSIPLPAILAGVSVTVNGAPAPLLAVVNRNGQEQVNFQAPFELEGSSSARIVVSRNNQASAAVDVPVLDVQPAIFTSDGVNAIAVHNADYSLATTERPLAPGEYAFVYGTGLGRVTNRPATGAVSAVAAAAVSEIRLTMAGQPCEVQYGGFAPGLVGVYQLNFRVPTGLAAGTQELIVSAGGAVSPPVRVPMR
jgi:uncharacterized protein (TIGR03437 family)